MGKTFVITGPRGVGKTFAAVTYARPSELGRVFYHDSENSASQVLEELAGGEYNFGHYVSLVDRFADLPGDDDLLDRINKGNFPWVSERQRRGLIEYYQYILSDLANNLTAGSYDVYVHDTIEKLEAGMAAWVETNKRKAGVSSIAFGRLWNEGVFPLYEQFLSAIYARGVKTIILVSHLKTPWEDKRPVIGKVVPSGKKLLYRLSSLMLWLVNEPSNANHAPAALVLKERLGKMRAGEDDEWIIERRLPHRIPSMTWRAVRAYLSGETPIDFANPLKGEALSSAELEMISELLTDKQMELMIAVTEHDTARLQAQTQPVIAQAPDFDKDALENEARELRAQGMSIEDIAASVGRSPLLVKHWVQDVPITAEDDEVETGDNESESEDNA